MVGPVLRPRSVWICLVFISGISFSFTSLTSPSKYAVSFRTLSARYTPHCLCPALIPRWLHVTCRVKPSIFVELAELFLVAVLPPTLVSSLSALPVDALESILQPNGLLGTLPSLPWLFYVFFSAFGSCLSALTHLAYPVTSYSSLETLFEVLDHKLNRPLHGGSHQSVPLGLLLERTDWQPWLLLSVSTRVVAARTCLHWCSQPMTANGLDPFLWNTGCC